MKHEEVVEGKLIKCLSCKGKGHVLYGGFSLLIPLVWIVAILERNNPRGETRMPCAQCMGTGFIRPQACTDDEPQTDEGEQ